MVDPRALTARLLVPLAAMALVLGAAGCSDDDGGADPEPTTTTVDAAEDEDDTAETTAGGTEADPGSLAARLPEVEGYEREVQERAGLDEGFCDGSTPSVTPAEVAGAEYLAGAGDAPGATEEGSATEAEDEVVRDTFYLAGVRLDDEGEASTFFDEFAATTSGCAAGDFSADAGTEEDLGDDGVSFTITDGDDGGVIYIARAGDVVWFYAHEVPADSDGPAPQALAAFTATVEG